MNLADLPLSPSIIDRYVVGSLAPFVAAGLSYLPELEAWLRIVTLIVGISVSILSFASAEADRRRRRKQNKNKED